MMFRPGTSDRVQFRALYNRQHSNPNKNRRRTADCFGNWRCKRADRKYRVCTQNPGRALKAVWNSRKSRHVDLCVLLAAVVFDC